MMKKGYIKAAFMAIVLALVVSAMPARDAEAGKKIIEDPETGLLVAVDDGEKEEEKPDALPTDKKIKKYNEWAKYFNMDELIRPYWNGATVPKHNLLGESEKYDGWMFVGSKGELRAACADSSIKYICIIPEYYSGKEIPKTSGSKDKVLIVPEGDFTNKSQWKEVWILDLWKYTESASNNNIVLYQARTAHSKDMAHLTIGKKAKNVKVSFAEKAKKDMAERAAENSTWIGVNDQLSPCMTVSASATATIDARGIPCIGTMTAGKKAKVTLIGNAQEISGNSKAKVTVKECSYLGHADIPVTATDKDGAPDFFQGYAVGVSGKAYNFMELRAGGKVTASGYGLVLRVYDKPTKTKIYCKNEEELPFVQARFTDLPTEKTVRDYLPVVYIGGKKKDSMIAAPSDLKAMLATFDTLGIKMTDSNAEKVRKLWRWGHAYCWHVNATDFNKYTDDRDYFTEGVYDGFNAYGNLAGVFYFRNTGCNRINQAMKLALNWLGGVESYCVHDAPLDHAYNIVKLDDSKWYFVDFCPSERNSWDIDTSKYPYDYLDFSMSNKYFSTYAHRNGEIVTHNASIWYETGLDEREDLRYVSAPEGILFQDGDVMPDGRTADYKAMSVKERMISNSGLEFGTEYIGYTVVYKDGGSWDYGSKEPEIFGYTDLGDTEDYGPGYTALFGMYDDAGLLAYYVDKNGNAYDPLTFEPLTQHQLEVLITDMYGENWRNEEKFHRRGEQG